MKKIADTRLGGIRLLDWSLFLAFTTIPFFDNLNSWSIGLFCGWCFFYNSLNDKVKLLRQNYFWLIPVANSFVFLASVLWDANGWGAASYLEKYSSYLVVPLMFAWMPKFDAKTFKRAMFSFVFSTALVCLICLIKSSIQYIHEGDYRIFFYHFLSNQLQLNAIYLSLYVSFSALIVLYYYFIVQVELTNFPKFLAILMIVFFYLMMLLLSSKMMLFLFLVLLISSFMYIAYLRKRILRGLILIMSLGIASIALLFTFPYLKWRLKTTIFKTYSDPNDDQNGWAVRELVWKSAIKLIRARPFTGYGIKNGIEQLVNYYQTIHFQIAYTMRLSCHNIYLQSLLDTGLLGFVPLILLLFFATKRAINQRNYLFIIFMTMVLFLGTTECILEIQKGITFFFLFMMLFYYHSPLLAKKEKEA